MEQDYIENYLPVAGRGAALREMDVVGRGAPHAGLVVVHVSPGQRGHAAVNVSLEVSGQRGGAVAEPVPLVHDGIHEPPAGSWPGAAGWSSPQLAGC